MQGCTDLLPLHASLANLELKRTRIIPSFDGHGPGCNLRINLEFNSSLRRYTIARACGEKDEVTGYSVAIQHGALIVPAMINLK